MHRQEITGAAVGEATVLFERSCGLEPVPLSARIARHFVRDFLAEAGRSEWAEAAELAVTEIVTNAVLHAHTSVEVHASLTRSSLLVEVRDGSSFMPAHRRYEVQATTGRGLELVAAVAAHHGVRHLGRRGKVVWFCLGAYDDRAAGARDGAGGGAGTGGHPDDVFVLLQQVPVRLWLAAHEHHDAILREYSLHRSQRTGRHPDLTAVDGARALLAAAMDAAIAAAPTADEATRLPAGHPASLRDVPAVVTADMRIHPHQVASFTVLRDALDEAERLAAADQLLVLPALPEITALREWVCDQVVVQAHGGEPASWRGVDDPAYERTATRVHDPMLTWDASLVTEAGVGVVAADHTNRIIAVSPPLAAALGWEVDELVGRRVLTIVPPRLREAHIAGFSRYLSTGEARILGMPLSLPVLHKDGSEATYPFFLERVALGGLRSVYVAWIDVPLVTGSSSSM